MHREHYDLVACSLYGGEQSTAHKYLRDRSVDGAIILTSSFDDRFLQSVASDVLPIVVLDRELKSPHIYNVLIDNFGGAFKAVNALLAKGCRDIYFSAAPNSLTITRNVWTVLLQRWAITIYNSTATLLSTLILPKRMPI